MEQTQSVRNWMMMIAVVMIFGLLGEFECKKSWKASKIASHGHVLKPFKFPMGESRVVGGRNVSDGEFPSYITLSIPTKHKTRGICGGVLIAKNIVLTAAHCLAKDRDYVSASNTIWHYREWKNHNPDVINVTKECIAPGFVNDTSAGLPNDFAVLKLERAVNETGKDQIVKMATKRMDLDTKVDVIGSGFVGKDRKGRAKQADRLKAIKMKVIECESKRDEKASHICMTTVEKKGNGCSGKFAWLEPQSRCVRDTN